MSTPSKRYYQKHKKEVIAAHSRYQKEKKDIINKISRRAYEKKHLKRLFLKYDGNEMLIAKEFYGKRKVVGDVTPKPRIIQHGEEFFKMIETIRGELCFVKQRN